MTKSAFQDLWDELAETSGVTKEKATDEQETYIEYLWNERTEDNYYMTQLEAEISKKNARIEELENELRGLTR